MKMFRALLAALALAMAVMPPTHAEDDSATQQASDQTYAALDTWLRAQALNQRCNLLHYFEVELVGSYANAAAQATPEGQDYFESMGSLSYDESDDIYQDMIHRHERMAATAVADAECSASNADIQAVRQLYFRELFKHLIGAHESAARKNDTEGRRAASDDLLKYVAGLYGDNAQTLMQTLANELTTEGADPNTEWYRLDAVTNDVLWEKRLRETGYVFAPVPDRPGWFRASKKDGSASLKAEFGALTAGKYHDKLDGVVDIKVSLARGWTEDGRLILLLSKDAANWGATALRADLLVQDDPNGMEWEVSDWRSRATAYTAEQLPAADCPADFCFVFPAALTEALRIRQPAGGAYAYELYIGAPDLFPLDQVSRSGTRERYVPPSVPETADSK